MKSVIECYKLGDVVKYKRTEYTVVAIFSDGGKDYFVGKKFVPKYNFFEYCHVFTFDEDGNLMKHI